MSAQLVDQSALRSFAVEVLVTTNVPRADALTVASHLVDADARGIPSHGIMRLPQYVSAIEAGLVDPLARISISHSAPALVRMEGHHALGQVAGLKLVEAVSSLAREYGVALGVARELGHTGRIGAYAEELARQGLVALAACSGPPSGHWVAPFGGKEGRLATNPIAFSYPVANDFPVVADFSTASTPEGTLRLLSSQGLRTTDDDLLDPEGRPTNDPSVLYATPRGSIRAFGGSRGYRGTALGILVEVLATLLSGDDVRDKSRVDSNLSVLAIYAPMRFDELSSQLSKHMRSAPPIDPSRPVLLPGEKESQMASASDQIRIASSTVHDLKLLGAACGVADPFNTRRG